MNTLKRSSIFLLFLLIITACNDTKTELPKEASQEYIDSTNKSLEKDIEDSKHRGNLIANGLKMGLTQEKAEAYADSIINSEVLKK